jgi:hypothetical protein
MGEPKNLLGCTSEVLVCHRCKIPELSTLEIRRKLERIYKTKLREFHNILKGTGRHGLASGTPALRSGDLGLRLWPGNQLP